MEEKGDVYSLDLNLAFLCFTLLCITCAHGLTYELVRQASAQNKLSIQ